MPAGSQRNPLLKGHRRFDPNRAVEQTILQSGFSGAVTELMDDDAYASLDRDRLEEWIEGLREVERDLRRLRLRLTHELAEPDAGRGAECAQCGSPVLGRTDRRYCSPACRQRAYRRRSA